MKMSERFKSAWNAFRNQNEKENFQNGQETYSFMSSSQPMHKKTLRRIGNERTIVNAIYTRIAVDAASVEIHHIQCDDNGRFLEYKDSDLEECLHVEANIDQTARAFRIDLMLSLMDEGVIAVCPIDTTNDPNQTDSYDIQSLRVGKITQWFPGVVRVDVYDERDGKHKEILFNKSDVAIIENPFYSVMNSNNSTYRRLIRKLDKLDQIDSQVASDKLDLLVQLPYNIRTPVQRARAQQRREDIEAQLTGSKYGIAYIDASEKVTQLNRSIENNLLSQIEYLTDMVYSQLGLTQDIMNGTASETAMLNYYNRTIAPFLNEICDEYKRKFLTITARTKGQTIDFFRDPFELVPVSQLADIADKFTRNEILSSNEVRGLVGFKPVNDSRADELRNKNINQSAASEMGEIEPVTTNPETSIIDKKTSDFQHSLLISNGKFIRRR